LNITIINICFREELKKALEKIKNFDDLLCDIVNICLLMFEQKTYLTPAEKHMLVKVSV
jgi:cytoplasmic FMR1 interacting protein